MDNGNFKNNKLKKLINNIKQNKIDTELITNELKMTKFIVPLVKEDETNKYLTLAYGEDNLDFIIPIFTDIEEYEKAEMLLSNKGIDIDLIKISSINDFIEIAENLSTFIGITINIATQNYLITNETLKLLSDKSKSVFDYNCQQLYQISQITDNYELLNVINSEKSEDIFDDVLNALNNSILFSIVYSQENLDDHAYNGTIDINNCPEHLDDLSILVEETPIGKCFVLFTDKLKIKSESSQILSQRPDLHIYSKISNISHICDIILSDDLEGIVINPSEESYYITKEEISNNYETIKSLTLDSYLNKSEVCIFSID